MTCPICRSPMAPTDRDHCAACRVYLLRRQERIALEAGDHELAAALAERARMYEPRIAAVVN